jgi:hypothetical protein
VRRRLILAVWLLRRGRWGCNNAQLGNPPHRLGPSGRPGRADRRPRDRPLVRERPTARGRHHPWVREVLLGSDPAGTILSRRASERLAQLRSEHPWVRPDTTSLVTDAHGRARWWTFAGWRANLWLARAAADLRREVVAVDDLTVALDPGATPQQLRRPLSNAAEAPIDLAPWVTTEAVDGLKFSECLPPRLATEVVAHRLIDPESTTRALGERLVGWRDAT